MTASPWIRSPLWDGVWMLSGFWVPMLLLLLPLLVPAGGQGLIVVLTLCLWIGHRLSSLYLGLCLGEYRPLLAQRKGYFFGLPLALGLLVTGFLLCPESVLPVPRFERVILLGLIDYFFSLYHFSVQHYGVLSVYRSRLPHGQRDPGLLRRDWWTCIGIAGVFSLLIDYANGETSLLSPLFDALGAPDSPLWSGGTFFALRWGLSLAVLIFWLSTMRIYHRRRQGPARMAYMSSLCYMSLISFHVDPVLYFVIVQIQHWLVSLGLASHMAANASQGDAQSSAPVRLWYRAWGWVNARPFFPLLILMLLSACLTPMLEADAYISGHFDTEVLAVQGFLSGFQDSIWLYLFAALAFASSFAHYIYDRGVFRMSDPLTRQAALPLLRSPEPVPGPKAALSQPPVFASQSAPKALRHPAPPVCFDIPLRGCAPHSAPSVLHDERSFNQSRKED